MSTKMLVIGGTAFIGRHTVEAAIERGYEITLFTRGQTNPKLFPELEHVHGDRDGGLGGLAGRSWDVVLDTSGYVPRVVRQSVELLEPNIGTYLYVSSLSVYGNFSVKGLTENSPLVGPPNPLDDETMANYGPLKALCEPEVTKVFPDRSTLYRAHITVGPFDNGLAMPRMLERVADGGAIVAPGSPDDPVQWIDARDLAEFMLDTYEKGTTGVFNVGCEPMSMGEVLTAAVEVLGNNAELVWCDEDFLLAHGVMPGAGPPMWMPKNGPGSGLNAIDVSKAYAQG